MILLIRERRNRNLHLLHEGGRAEQHLPITDARTIAAVFIVDMVVRRNLIAVALMDLFLEHASDRAVSFDCSGICQNIVHLHSAADIDVVVDQNRACRKQILLGHHDL